jgi:hypothetical protein
VLELLDVASVMVMREHAVEGIVADTLALGSASALQVLFTVPALVVAEGNIVLVTECCVDDGLLAIPLAVGVDAREALVFDAASRGRGGVGSGIAGGIRRGVRGGVGSGIVGGRGSGVRSGIVGGRGSGVRSGVSGRGTGGIGSGVGSGGTGRVGSGSGGLLALVLQFGVVGDVLREQGVAGGALAGVLLAVKLGAFGCGYTVAPAVVSACVAVVLGGLGGGVLGRDGSGVGGGGLGGVGGGVLGGVGGRVAGGRVAAIQEKIEINF